MAVGFYVDLTACVGCKTCLMACKDVHDLEVGVLYRTVHEYEGGEYPNPVVFHLSVSCNHCENPACMAVCPAGAISVNDEGAVILDRSMCIGCKSCASACPYMVPQFSDVYGICEKCDTCVDIRATGELPACVASCPMRALDFGDWDELQKKYPDAVVDMPYRPDSSATTPHTLFTLSKPAMTQGCTEVHY